MLCVTYVLHIYLTFLSALYHAQSQNETGVKIHFSKNIWLYLTLSYKKLVYLYQKDSEVVFSKIDAYQVNS